MTIARSSVAAALLLSAFALAPSAQSPATRTFRVRETAGIRRTEYPITARITLPRGSIKTAGEARLTSNEMEVVAQFTSASSWEDGSVQALDVDFNATLDPEEERRYVLQYGSGVAATAKPARGLTAEDLPDAVQVGAVRFSKSGSPLIASAMYGGERIAQGGNGLALTDSKGQRHDLSSAQNPRLEIVRPGPVTVGLRYTAAVPVEPSYSVPVEILIEMPNSKSWVKLVATVRDPSRRVRDISIETPLAFGALPVLWDFGTDSGTYGVFRNAADAVLLTQTRNASGGNWKIETSSQGQPRRPYETSAGTRVKVASGWGHLQDAKAAVAFAVEGFGRDEGTYSVSLDGKGQTSFRTVPAESLTEHHLTVYEHFVSTPVAIGAATNPTSMLRTPAVILDR
jgi:hypothetical protein